MAWLGVAGWVALVGFLMLSPGKNSVVEDTSRAFGGTDLTDALGHTALFGILTGLLAHALRFHTSPDRALTWAAAIALAFGSVLEPAQLLAYERGASVLDLLANWIGALGAAAGLRWMGFAARAIPPSDAPESRR